MKKEDLMKIGFHESVGENQQRILRYDIYINECKECYIELSERAKYVVPCLVVLEDNWDFMNTNQTHLFMKNCNTIKKLKKQIEQLENVFGNLNDLNIE